jgi:hypothetical protein
VRGWQPTKTASSQSLESRQAGLRFSAPPFFVFDLRLEPPLRVSTFVPNTPLGCKLSQVIIHMNLQELAPLFWRHLAEHRMRLPGIGGSRVPVRLQDS